MSSLAAEQPIHPPPGQEHGQLSTQPSRWEGSRASLGSLHSQKLIQHLISTFIKLVIFLRKLKKCLVSKNEVRRVTRGAPENEDQLSPSLCQPGPRAQQRTDNPAGLPLPQFKVPLHFHLLDIQVAPCPLHTHKADVGNRASIPSQGAQLTDMTDVPLGFECSVLCVFL